MRSGPVFSIVKSTLAVLVAIQSQTARAATISPKVFIVDYFSSEQTAWYGIPEFNLTAQNMSLPGLSVRYPEVFCTADGSICQLVTDEGEINASNSAMALVLSPEFNLTQTYFLMAGIAGISPKVTTLGSVTFARFAIQVALQYEFDAREKPSNFSTGYVPIGSTEVGEYPQSIYGTEVYEVNDALRQRAMAFAMNATLNDTASAQAYRKMYTGEADFQPMLKGPSVVGCDTATSDVWWSGDLLGSAFENTTKLFTNGSAAYCSTAQEDSGVLGALVRGAVAHRVDFSRVIIMRTGSDVDRPAPNVTAADNLFNGLDAGFDASITNLMLAGVQVVQGIVSGWNSTFEAGIAPQNYIGDIFGSLGGSPNFGPGSIFNGSAAPSPASSNQSNTTANASSSASVSRFASLFQGLAKAGYGVVIYLGSLYFFF